MSLLFNMLSRWSRYAINICQRSEYMRESKQEQWWLRRNQHAGFIRCRINTGNRNQTRVFKQKGGITNLLNGWKRRLYAGFLGMIPRMWQSWPHHCHLSHFQEGGAQGLPLALLTPRTRWLQYHSICSDSWEHLPACWDMQEPLPPQLTPDTHEAGDWTSVAPWPCFPTEDTQNL